MDRANRPSLARPAGTRQAQALEAQALARSERDIVVHVAVAGAGSDRAARRGSGRTARTEIAAGIVGPETAAAAARAAVEHGQRRVEALQHHFGRVFLDPALVGPFAGLERALDVHLGALLQILLDDLAERLGEDHHAV